MVYKKNINSKLSQDAQRAMKGQKIQIKYNSEKEKYSKGKYAVVYKGYDFLENLGVVRDFIQRKYDVDRGLFELLLKLMGMKIFSRAEFTALPKRYTYRKLKYLIEMGYVNQISDHWDIERRVYTLNTAARNIIINFYKYLSGELKIPETEKLNPIARGEFNFDKKKMELIKKMNQTPIPEHHKKLFE